MPAYCTATVTFDLAFFIKFHKVAAYQEKCTTFIYIETQQKVGSLGSQNGKIEEKIHSMLQNKMATPLQKCLRATEMLLSEINNDAIYD